MELEELIHVLKKEKYSKFPNIDFVINRLEKLDSLVEMTNVKKSFAGQLALIIAMARRGFSPPFKKMHSILSGPPGVGKTTVSVLMAEIWSALGIIGKKKPFVILEANSLSEPEEKSEDYVDEKKDIAYIVSSVQDKMDDIIRVIDKVHGKDDVGKVPEIIRTIHSKSSDSADLCQEIIDKYSKYFMHLDEEETSEDFEDFEITPCVILGRQDFVGTHQGHTAQKTEKVLKENKGKVIIIEEAYLLSTDSKDSYGMEALTIINRYMDEHPNDYIFIFNGYEDLLEKSIFKAQPGLRRRIQWMFEVENYSYEGLYKIFKHQLSNYKNPIWSIEFRDEKKYLDFFSKNIDKFPHFGGDTERLILNIQLEYAKEYFDKSIDDMENITIDYEVFQKGFKKYLENFTEPKIPLEKRSPPEGMYI